MMEEWRATGIAGLDVSSEGRVRGPRGIRALQPGPKGYLQLMARVDGKITCQRVHKLVCVAFHGDRPSPEHVAAHRNGDPADNRAENLRWATRQENWQDRKDHGRSRWTDTKRGKR